MRKQEARKIYLHKRQSLSETEIQDLDEQLLHQFMDLSLERVGYLHLFLPIAAKKEVNTWLIADWLKLSHPHIRLVLSKSDFENHTLRHFCWDEHTELTENSWGITEPQNGTEVEVNLVDMVLVPLLVCDEKGQRVGYGKGFYDRFLADCRPDVRKVGLAHFEPIAAITDANRLDVPLDACITPRRIWEF